MKLLLNGALCIVNANAKATTKNWSVALTTFLVLTTFFIAGTTDEMN